MTEKPLQGKAALVTGAGRGIGRAIAVTLAGAGAAVALAARTRTELGAVQGEIEAAGGSARVFPADLSDERQCVSLVGDVAGTFGGVDILVNNAAIGRFGPVDSFTADDWDAVMSVNARAPFIICREAIPHLRKRRPSHIVNISSVVGVKGYVNQAAYTMSKHALLGLTKVLARELQKDGVRVHALCPGGVDTGMVGDARPDLDRSVLILPQEIADTVLFLVTRSGNAVIDQVDIRRSSATPFP